MIDYSKMTDEELNEAIFKAKGGNKEFVEAYKKEMFEWSPVASIARWQYAAPDYTHDWRLAGELLEEMAMDGGGVSFMGKWHVDYKAGHNAYKMVSAPAPQRAICEAWLAWKELENK